MTISSQGCTRPQRWRRRLPAAVLFGTLVLAACGSGSDTSVSDAAAELTAAVDRTLDADSFHIELSSASDAGGTAAVDYNAPDRIRIVSDDGAESIIVGDTLYFSDFERPDHFLSTRRPGSAPARSLLMLLEAIRDADNVDIDGDELVVTLAGGAGNARVRVRDGYVVRLQLRAGAGSERIDAIYQLSRFDAADEISAPPADKVSEALVPPACPEDGETPERFFLCLGGDRREPEEVELPSPSEPSESALQLRPVQGDAPGGCSALDENPHAAEPVVLADSDGHCLALEAAGLEVERVKQLGATRHGEVITLNITLGEADARRFDDLAEESVGERLALVIFGQVVSAPTVEAADFEGRLVIPGLTMDEAARVRAALT